MTIIQKFKYLFIVLRYQMTRCTPTNKCKINDNVLVISLEGKKLLGVITSIDEIKSSDSEILDYVYEIKHDDNSYLINGCHILCILKCKMNKREELLDGNYLCNGSEGIEFFTCGDYTLCKECTDFYKPCHENQKEMYNEYITKQAINEKKQEKEMEKYCDEISELIDC